MHPNVRRLVPFKATVFALAGAFALAACHHDAAPSATDAAATGDDSTPLPKPAPASGPVTGMPTQPGPGPVGPPAAATIGEPTLPPEAALATDAGDADAQTAAAATANAGAATPGAAAAPSAGDAGAEPTAEDAAATVRTYFSAIASHDFARAHALWSEGGDASGHSVAQLAGEYADVAAIDATVGAPGRLDAAAGSRYIKVPVSIARSLRDGSTQRLAGTVALRRSAVDGATPEQRAWRIAWTDLRAAPATPPAQ